MLKLIENELIKIFKRKNVYILLVIGVLIIIIYNLFEKFSSYNIDINMQYQRAYNNDRMLLENYDELNIDDSYEEIEERIKLEEYAINNKIQYNIFLNTTNKNVQLPSDARIILLKLFDNFDIIIIFILIYLSSTIVTEEYSVGTIKHLLAKPHSRTQILFSKIITNIFIIAIVIGFITLFDSYNLDAIIYNSSDKTIETIELTKYMIKLITAKIPLYIVLSLISLTFGIITNNIALDILVSLGIYIILKSYDVSKYLYSYLIIIYCITIIILLLLLTVIFNKKDIKNL